MSYFIFLASLLSSKYSSGIPVLLKSSTCSGRTDVHAKFARLNGKEITVSSPCKFKPLKFGCPLMSTVPSAFPDASTLVM